MTTITQCCRNRSERFFKALAELATCWLCLSCTHFTFLSLYLCSLRYPTILNSMNIPVVKIIKKGNRVGVVFLPEVTIPGYAFCFGLMVISLALLTIAAIYKLASCLHRDNNEEADIENPELGANLV